MGMKHTTAKARPFPATLEDEDVSQRTGEKAEMEGREEVRTGDPLSGPAGEWRSSRCEKREHGEEKMPNK